MVIPLCDFNWNSVPLNASTESKLHCLMKKYQDLLLFPFPKLTCKMNHLQKSCMGCCFCIWPDIIDKGDAHETWLFILAFIKNNSSLIAPDKECKVLLHHTQTFHSKSMFYVIESSPLIFFKGSWTRTKGFKSCWLLNNNNNNKTCFQFLDNGEMVTKIKTWNPDMVPFESIIHCNMSSHVILSFYLKFKGCGSLNFIIATIEL